MSRKDFPEWKVDQVYDSQEGVCGRVGCNRPLSHGFARHHKDGDPKNIDISNLVLYCPECHYATYKGNKKKELERHRKQEREALENINALIEEALTVGKISGATLERLIDATKLGLRISRQMAGIDKELENVPPSIALTVRLQEMQALQEIYLEGFKEGVKAK